MIRRSSKKKINYNLSDLVDRLAIDQIKQIQLEKSVKNYEKSISKIGKSIDLLFKRKKIKLNDQLVGIFLSLSQINLFIWITRKEISNQRKPDPKKIKLSHQLNALRNQLKNKLSKIYYGKSKSSEKKTNTNKEDLLGWNLSSLNE